MTTPIDYSKFRRKCRQCAKPIEDDNRRFSRCLICRKAHALYMRDYHLRTGRNKGGPLGRPTGSLNDDPGGERARRVELYAALVESGARLFE